MFGLALCQAVVACVLAQPKSACVSVPRTVDEAVRLLDVFPSPRFVNAVRGGGSASSAMWRYLRPPGASDANVLAAMRAYAMCQEDVLVGLAKYTTSLVDVKSRAANDLRARLLSDGVPRVDLEGAYWGRAFDDSAKLRMLCSYLDRSSRGAPFPWLVVAGRITFRPEQVPAEIMRSLTPESGGNELLHYLRHRGKG